MEKKKLVCFIDTEAPPAFPLTVGKVYEVERETLSFKCPAYYLVKSDKAGSKGPFYTRRFEIVKEENDVILDEKELEEKRLLEELKDL